MAVRFTTSFESISPVNSAVISAMPPQVADTTPATDVEDWLEIDHWRSVQLEICGNPGSVGELHVPSKPPPDDDEGAGEGDEELDDALDGEAVSDAVVALGAVGRNDSVLF